MRIRIIYAIIAFLLANLILPIFLFVVGAPLTVLVYTFCFSSLAIISVFCVILLIARAVDDRWIWQ